MPINKGDRLVHAKTGMRCKAITDEDDTGMVMTKQNAGVVSSIPAADLNQDHADVPVKSTGNVDIVARRNRVGSGYVAVIKDKLTGTEKIGAASPGDPDDFNYNEVKDTWSTKP